MYQCVPAAKYPWAKKIIFFLSSKVDALRESAVGCTHSPSLRVFLEIEQKAHPPIPIGIIGIPS